MAMLNNQMVREHPIKTDDLGGGYCLREMEKIPSGKRVQFAT